jgi:cation diffusion facilitator CzcD-associated flavoprotein CzcO
MTNTLPTASTATEGAVEHFDAIVMGAGVSGSYQLYCLRELRLAVRCFEDGGERLRGG